MDEEIASRRLSISRSALGDVTNRIGKRGDSGRVKGEVKVRDFDFNDRAAVKRICFSPRSCSEINSLKGNVISSLSNIPIENREPDLHDDGDEVHCLEEKNYVGDVEGGKVLDSVALEANDCSQLDSLKENKISEAASVANENKSSNLDLCVYDDAIHPVNTEVNSEFGDDSHADNSRTVSSSFLHDERICEVGEENVSREGNLNDQNADNFVLSQSGSVDCALLPQSQESRVFGVEKFNEQKVDECAHMTGGTNAIMSCSCSFCTKAANIWLDLNQRDIKYRLSALKKSQKDASILAERSSRIIINEKHGAESVTRASELESHLMNQWRSLFQHMSDIWEAESNQLEASLLPLNNLKDKCKAELELINAKLPDKH